MHVFVYSNGCLECMREKLQSIEFSAGFYYIISIEIMIYMVRVYRYVTFRTNKIKICKLLYIIFYWHKTYIGV